MFCPKCGTQNVDGSLKCVKCGEAFPQVQQAAAPAQGDPALNSKAVTSMVLGIIGLLAWILPLIGLPVTIIGLVKGIKGLKSVKRGIAIAGVTMCIIGLTLTTINFSIGAYMGATGQHSVANKLLGQ